MNTSCKKLIEVAMPIKEISAESVRDKSIRHGHISTLHLWWARRPLPVCRAVVFASLVPDPLDENCPQPFRDAVEKLLGKAENQGDPYKPYPDIPYTAATNDAMEDNLRNRLLMFIGKFSEKYAKMGEKTPAKEMLTESSLIKWDNKNNETIITKARKLIWVAYNTAHLQTPTGPSDTVGFASAEQLLTDFDTHYAAIKSTELALYGLPDRHLPTPESMELEANLHNAIEAFLDRMPRVFDPFAGGGAIPLEAARLGCRSFGNDINPVAHIIQKGSLEFPQKYGKPITYSKEEFIKLYGIDEFNRIENKDKIVVDGEAIAVNIANRLSFDVEFYAKKLLAETEKEIGFLYPKDENGNKPVVYYWAKTALCSNPSCGVEVPLLRNFYMCNKKDKQVYLHPLISQKSISFEIKNGQCETEGFASRGNLKCPCCGSITDVKKIKEQSIAGELNQILIAVIYEGSNSKEYRLPRYDEIDILNKLPWDIEVPSEDMQRNSAGGDTFSWGISKWGQLFAPRQLLAIHTLVDKLNESKSSIQHTDNLYYKAIITYLGILINRITPRSNMFGLWNTSAETLEHIFGRQAIPMVFDYPESNIFSSSGGGLLSQIDWITRYIEGESRSEFNSTCNHAESGDKSQFAAKTLTAVITDPPYYDAIAYADLSDFFYVWYKRTLSDIYPSNFATPQTPKSEECTALKHHHSGDADKAKLHFENKLINIFDAIEIQTSDLVSIMFAHQSTDAWTTLCNSILSARMNITGSWAIDTERSSAGTKASKAFLSSSVTVSCRPVQKEGYGDYKKVKREIENTVALEVDELYHLGFRGADLLTACFGQAVSEFGKYEKVEKADGSEVTVAELLDMARESAFNALLKGFDGDDFTKFYIGWLQLYGFVESDFDDAAKFSRVGLSINVQELFTEHILVKNGNKQTLGTFGERLKVKPHMGEKTDSYLIDQVHRAMALYKGADRKDLLHYIGQTASSPDGSFWRVVTSLCEILPSGCDDHKQATGLIVNKESLIRESKNEIKQISQQTILDL